MQDLPAEQYFKLNRALVLKALKSERIARIFGPLAQKLAPTMRSTGINVGTSHCAQVKSPHKAHICGHFRPHPAHTLLARERASSYSRTVPRGNHAQYRVRADLLRFAQSVHAHTCAPCSLLCVPPSPEGARSDDTSLQPRGCLRHLPLRRS